MACVPWSPGAPPASPRHQAPAIGRPGGGGAPQVHAEGSPVPVGLLAGSLPPLHPAPGHLTSLAPNRAREVTPDLLGEARPSLTRGRPVAGTRISPDPAPHPEARLQDTAQEIVPSS